MNIFESLTGLGELASISPERDVISVKFSPASKYEIRLYRPEAERFKRLREQDPNHPIPVRIDLVYRESGKSVRGFKSHINPWWLRQFVYAMAKAVAYTEREWDTMTEEYVNKTESAGS